jgi:hypothetical protein
MTAVNHALTGTLIGLVVGRPAVAVPAALASHFVCDALPHYGSGLPEKVVLASRRFRNYLLLEALLCILIVATIWQLQPDHWLLAIVCAFAAASPDLLSINRYLSARRRRKWSGNPYTHFARRIQWFERPIGAVVEIAWFTAAIILLIPFLS